MKEPEWVIKPVVLALHREQLTEHGGRPGLRDDGLLASALQRPQDKFHYDKADLFALAAAYADGLASNHPFIDGNKRVSYVTMRTFPILNGSHIDADDTEKVTRWLALASGDLDEHRLALWAERHSFVL